MDLLWGVAQTLGAWAAILGGAAGAAYWIFKVLAERWLNAKFDQRLEELKHSHLQELERLRFRISAMMDRTTKLHQREYDTLPALWEALASAWTEVGAWISSFKSYPDVNRMSEMQLQEFLVGTELTESQKIDVKESSDKTKAYIDAVYWHRKAAVTDTARSFSRYLKFNGIFVLPEIKNKAAELDDLMWKCSA